MRDRKEPSECSDYPASGLRFHEIDCEQIVYPRDGPVAGYFYAHPEPAALIYWFADEVGPAVRKALELRLPGKGSYGALE